MGGTIIISGEEYQITWYQLVLGYWHTHLILGICGAWKINSGIGKYITYITGAIKATWGSTSEYVRYTNVVHRVGNDTTGNRVKATAYLWHIPAHQSRIGGRTYQAISRKTLRTLKILNCRYSTWSKVAISHNIIAKAGQLTLNFSYLTSLISHTKC